MSWGRPVGVLLALSLILTAGCRQHCFMTEADYHRCQAAAIAGVQACPEQVDPLPPSIEAGSVSTVLNPEGQRRPITLAEAVAVALENGRTGQFLNQRTSASGLIDADRGSPSNRTDRLRVFAYDPAQFGAEIEASLARFDARWQTSMTWNKIDRPVGTGLDVLQTAFAPLEAIEIDRAQFRSDLLKPLPTGGLAGITFQTDYELSNTFSRVNPAYRPSIGLSFEQPLLQGAGVLINRIRDRHPGAIQAGVPGQFVSQAPGILIARINYDQSQLEFQRRVEELLFAVEEAYWDLYFAYWDLYTRETAMGQAHRAWQLAKERFEAGTIPVQDFAQVEAEFHRFRAERLQALGNGRLAGRGVLEAERRLRYVIGLPPEDGCRLIPTDTPVLAPVRPDWCVALGEAMSRRAELLQARQGVHQLQLAVLREKDQLLPDLRFFANYNVNALGDRLDGEGPNSALRNLAENRFNDWGLGLRADIPIGFREAHAETRRARLRFAQSLAFLYDQEEKVTLDLQRAFRELIQGHEEIEIQKARREAAAARLQAQYQAFLVGRGRQDGVPVIDLLLRAQRDWADALLDEHRAIYQYNVAIIDFERQKGTILDYDNVAIVEGELPSCAKARASEHVREQARAVPVKLPPGCNQMAGMCDSAPAAEPVLTPRPPLLQEAEAASLPTLPPPRRESVVETLERLMPRSVPLDPGAAQVSVSPPLPPAGLSLQR